jgi:hypothetical protein
LLQIRARGVVEVPFQAEVVRLLRHYQAVFDRAMWQRLRRGCLFQLS